MNCFGPPETEEERRQKEISKGIDQQLRKEKVEYKATHRLLLLGTLHFFIFQISNHTKVLENQENLPLSNK